MREQPFGFCLRRSRPREEAPPRDRRERHGALQLRIVLSAHAVQGVRPTVIEHELALAVRFGVERHHARDCSVRSFKHEMLRQPSRPFADRPGLFKRIEEGVREERVVPRRLRVRANQSATRSDRCAAPL